jgi:hypothetical protein
MSGLAWVVSVIIWVKCLDLLATVTYVMGQIITNGRDVVRDPRANAREGWIGYPRYPPFGYQDVRLREWSGRSSPFISIPARTLLAVFKYPILVFIATIAALFVSPAAPASFAHYRILYAGQHTMYLLLLSSVFCSLLVALLAVIEYAARAISTILDRFERTSAELPNAGWLLKHLNLSPQFFQLARFAGTFIMTLLSSFSAVFYCASTSNGFSGIPKDSSFWIRILDSSYFTMSTFTTVQYGDIAPRSPIARLIAIALEIETFALVVIVLTLIAMARKESP